jgi:NADPH:quinone reductase-like Zn-dependent oxidoreductase
VQFAKISGAVVTAVCSAESAALARELGADHVVDYEEEDFARHEERYDVIFDVVGNRSFGGCKQGTPSHRRLRHHRARSPQLPEPDRNHPRAQKGPRRPRKALGRASRPAQTTLRGGRLRVVLDSVYPLEEVAEAHAHGETGHARGKIVLRVDR